jgi:phage terminase large subunit GpA-like protein
MIFNSEWRAASNFNGVAGFHLSELYSPWVCLTEMVSGFLANKNLTETLKTWVNTSLGECWEPKAESLEHEAVFSKCEKYSTEVPNGVLLLTAGIDV